MIFRNSIRMTLRARGRTSLFTALILLLTLSLTLGLGMYAWASGMLAAMDEQYTSVALAEYIGEDYPDPDASDAYARQIWEQVDPAALSGLAGVQAWEPWDETLAALEGYERIDGTIPYEGWAVLEASGFYPVNTVGGKTIYSARIVNTLYNQNDRGTMMMVEAGDTGFEPEAGASYLIHGTFSDSNTSNPTLYLVDFDTGEPAFYKLSGADDPALTDSIFTQRAAYYAAANNYIRITASDMPKALEEFHQGVLTLEEGRFPEAGETGVCVVDGRMAAQMNLATGDELRLTLLDSDENDRFLLTERGSEKNLTIVGITSFNEDWSGHVWVSEGEGGFSQPFFGFRLGMAVLDNARARQTADDLRQLMPEGVQVTLYDQGYFAAAQPLAAMETTALAVAGASACGAAAVLVLFASLFIGRQKETVGILRSLGTPVWKIRLWLLSGAGMIAAAAAAAGAILGRLFMGTMIRWALDAARSLYAVDQRYSESAMGISLSVEEISAMPLWPAIASGIGVFAAALILCVVFLSQALDQSAPKKGKEKVRVPRGKTSVLGQGIFRYSPIFAIRSAGRSLIVIAASMILTLFLGILLILSGGWQTQMDQLYDTAQIRGRVTSTSGRQATNLLVSGENVQLLWGSDMLSDIGVSIGWNYWFPEEMPAFGEGGFAQETKNNWIARQPKLTAINSLLAAPAFYYDEDVQVQWLEGWDESFLSDDAYYPVTDSIGFMDGETWRQGQEPLTYPCIVSQEFFKARGFELGDTFSVRLIVRVRSFEIEIQPELRIVGAYSASGEEGIYVPLSFWTYPGFLTGEGADAVTGEAVSPYSESGMDQYVYTFQRTNFSTCRFTLKSARMLDSFRQYLADYSVSQAGVLGENRMTVVLEDQSFAETAGGLGRLISFCRILFPALFAAVCLLGFVISWLMTGSRRMEFAILRGIGTSGIKVFLIFFLEQMITCLCGSILGGLILTAFGSTGAAWTAAGGFFLCYMGGAAVSVMLAERTKLMDLLSERE